MASSTQIDEPLAEMVRTGDTSRNLHVPYMSLGAVHMLVHLILKQPLKVSPSTIAGNQQSPDQNLKNVWAWNPISYCLLYNSHSAIKPLRILIILFLLV